MEINPWVDWKIVWVGNWKFEWKAKCVECGLNQKWLKTMAWNKDLWRKCECWESMNESRILRRLAQERKPKRWRQSWRNSGFSVGRSLVQQNRLWDWAKILSQTREIWVDWFHLRWHDLYGTIKGFEIQNKKEKQEQNSKYGMKSWELLSVVKCHAVRVKRGNE